VLSKERREAVRCAVDRLPPRSRRLLELLLAEQRSYKDVSEILAMPIGSIGPTRERVLRRLAREPEIACLAVDGAPGA
jgi:DNA-directed RNA polymerase specialized sigma24 family protein